MGADLHIHAGTLSALFIFGEKDDASYAIKPTCWPGLDIIPSCLALHRIETELMGKFDEGNYLLTAPDAPSGH
jgi:chromosome partitioning protein